MTLANSPAFEPNVTDYPDPQATASLYADGHLDAVIAAMLAPVFSSENLDDGYLWMMRYGLRGDHVKIRIHGEASRVEAFRTALERSSTEAFDNLPPEPGPGPKISSKAPIDEEDELEGSVGRGLIWTRYRRSHVCFGEPELFRHGAFCAHLTRALGAGSRILLEKVDPGSMAAWSAGARFNLLLRSVADGLAELPWDLSVLCDYVRYHRDWLLRFTAGDRDEEEARRAACERFDLRRQKMPDGGRKIDLFALGRLDTVRQDQAASSFRGEIQTAVEGLEPICRQEASAIDSFAKRPVFSPLFKIFQGLSNPIGLNLVEEAYVHHLLLRALESRIQA